MALPTTNLKVHMNASTNADAWKFFQAGTPYHNTNGADGENIEVWDDADGKALSFIYTVGGSATGPTYRSATPLMALPCLDFDGSTEFLRLLDDSGVTPTACSSILAAGAKTILLSLYIEGVTTNAANAWQNEGIVSDGGETTGGGFFGMFLKNTGSVYKLLGYNWDGSADVVEKDVLLNTSYVVMLRHDGSNLYLSLNGGAESSVASGNTTSLTNPFAIGRGYQTSLKFLNGRIGEIAVYNVDLSGQGSDLATAISYFTDKWLPAAGGLSIPVVMNQYRQRRA